MGDMGAAPIFVLFLVIVVVAVVIGSIQAAKRREAWKQLAQRLGCTFSARDPFNIEYSYPQALFRRGHGRRAYNVLHGRVEGRDVCCFDYVYKTSSGTGKDRSEQSHYHTCLLLTSPIAFQSMSIRPESFFDRIGEFFGLDDIDFESDEFSRRFHVKSADKRFAYDIIHTRTMELLLRCGKIHLEANSTSLLFYYSGSLNVPDEAETLIQRGLEFLELIPDYLLEQQRRTAN